MTPEAWVGLAILLVGTLLIITTISYTITLFS